jgi:hypothetical protein
MLDRNASFLVPDLFIYYFKVYSLQLVEWGLTSIWLQ